MYIAPGQGQKAPRGQNFDVNRKALPLYPFVASFKEISLKSDFIHFFHDLIHVYSPGAGAYSLQGTKFWCQQKFLVTSVICCQFQIIDDNSFWKTHCFTFFPYKSIRDQIWPCRKIGQGQPRFIIWTNLVVLKHPMTHTKIQGHWPSGCGEEDCLRFYHIWPWRPAWSCDQDHLSQLSFPNPIEAPYEIWLWLAQWFLRRCLKSVDDDDGRRTTEAYLSYKLTIWAFGSGELKTES